jgi:gamma-glutamylcyclotransferase (GGCT)/AIG2-like uncharacterized protein YtfP
MVKDLEGPGVHCEIVEINPSALGKLDLYEGYDPEEPRYSLFTREKVTLENGEEVLVYFYSRELRPEHQLVPSGKWEDNK